MPTDLKRAIAYPALILADESYHIIMPGKLQSLLKAAGIEDVEPIWTTLFAKAFKGKDVKDTLTEVGSKASGEAAGGKIEGEEIVGQGQDGKDRDVEGDEESSDNEDTCGRFGSFE